MIAIGRFFRLKSHRAVIAVWCVLALAAILPAGYYAQTQGVCLKAGRILSKEELRKAILMNVINGEIENIFRYNGTRGNGLFFVGISSPALETDLRKIIDVSYINGKSIENNFGLNILLKGNKKEKYKTLTVDQILEPLIFITYETSPSGDIIFFSSIDMQEIPFLDLDAKHKAMAESEMSISKRLLGYGNHYFYFRTPSFITFKRACCDNRDQDSESYLEEKQKAYNDAISSIARHAEIRESVSTIAVVSNCGNFLTTKDNYIHWLGNQFEDEDWP
ncbi:MAG: hypothetical protein LBP86_03395 [Azoarcus sp.]|jgi:hypothetical protein|nr:hypothetical protein [Azoarcus sp.]